VLKIEVSTVKNGGLESEIVVDPQFFTSVNSASQLQPTGSNRSFDRRFTLSGYRQDYVVFLRPSPSFARIDDEKTKRPKAASPDQKRIASALSRDLRVKTFSFLILK